MLLREYMGSETFIKLDDIMTPRIKRTRSVPQGDASAADLFGAALDIAAAAFFERCQAESGESPWTADIWDCCCLRTTAGLSRCPSTELPRMARAWNDLLEKVGLRVAWQEALWCCSATDTPDATITVSEVEMTRRSRNMASRHWRYGSLLTTTS